MVVNSAEIWNSKQRIDGFMAAARRIGNVETRVIEVGMTPQLTAQSVFDALGERRPTALLAASGIATLGTLRALQDREIKIPEDISLLGFDDVPWMEVLRPAISVVAQPIEEIARHAWELMRSAFEGRPQKPHVQLGATIIERDSTRRIGPK
jgi:DNA-binding LacI/PurR family transcriptional regulator